MLGARRRRGVSCCAPHGHYQAPGATQFPVFLPTCGIRKSAQIAICDSVPSLLFLLLALFALFAAAATRKKKMQKLCNLRQPQKKRKKEGGKK